MNPDHAHFADWDAAYVLGALGSSDRRRFEEHLAGCEACRTAISEIAPTLGLLSRIAPDRAQSMLAEPASPPLTNEGPDAPHASPRGASRRAEPRARGPAARARLVEQGARDARRRRRVWWTGALAAAAALIAVVVLAVTTAILPTLRGIQVVALEPLRDLPLTATVELSDAAWGTRIEMTCEYGETADDDAPADGRPYALVITAVDGTTSDVSSWRAFPGTTARLSAGTALEPDEIAAIEIRSIASGRVLMRTELDPPESAGE